MTGLVSNAFSITISGMPSWVTGAPVLTWAELPNTLANTLTIGGDNDIFAYSGAVLYGNKLLANGGGHNDYFGNEILQLDLSVDSPSWSVLEPTSGAGDRSSGVKFYLDGKPSSRHTYWALQYIPQHNRLFQLGGFAAGSVPQTQIPDVTGFNLLTGEWDPENTWPDTLSPVTSEQGYVFDGTRIWEFNNKDGKLYRCDVSAATPMTWTLCGALLGSSLPSVPVIHDPVRDWLFRTDRMSFAGGQKLSLTGYLSGMPTATNITYSGTKGATLGSDGAYRSMVYCPDRIGADGLAGTYLLIKFLDATFEILEISPHASTNTWAVEPLVVDRTGGTLPAMPSSVGGNQYYYGRFQYLLAYKTVVLAHAANKNVVFFRIA